MTSGEQKHSDSPLVTLHCLPGGQGRVRTSVGHMGRQIYSLLLLTAQPPVRKLEMKTAQTLAGSRRVCERKLPPRPDGLPDRPVTTCAAAYNLNNCTRFLRAPPSPLDTRARLSLGAGEGIRTPDPLITNQMLYRLSYASRPKPTNYMKEENELQHPLNKLCLLLSEGRKPPRHNLLPRVADWPLRSIVGPCRLPL